MNVRRRRNCSGKAEIEAEIKAERLLHLQVGNVGAVAFCVWKMWELGGDFFCRGGGSG